ncbi:hypothetical protein H0B56_02840 [Haloechinothrix sp. YIM 98757]|uniref:Uncharacterized protein n=1 Tax=Haloechinothrix aidingensis TaxID=2752311 RepID=A0A838A079_9PSEU|nr:hypothetical protein [Haloechinothrix aidingensis]MBA0124473.1 hypothetical protein [Haloechinothrix aidingensis]
MRVRHERLATPWFDYLLCSPRELEEPLADSPWQLTDVHQTGSGDYLAIMERR